MKFTTEQERAIKTRGGLGMPVNVLVSAAAGSGKTTVLCERIKRQIAEDGMKLEEMIVVSFNTESAADIRSKLLKNLMEAYGDAHMTPASKRNIFREMTVIDRAQISTIHSFALKLIKENTEKLGLPTKIRNMDEGEQELLKNEIMNRVISSAYRDDEVFGEMSDILTSDRDGDFSAMFLKLYDKLQNEPDGVSLLKEKAGGLEGLCYENFQYSPWGKRLLSERYAALDFYKDRFYEAATSYTEGSKGARMYGTRFFEAHRLAEKMKNAKSEEEYAELVLGAKGISFVGTRGTREDKGENYEYYKGVFDAFKKSLENELLPAYQKEEFQYDIEKTVGYALCTHRLLSEFEKAYSDEKKRRGLIDYTDMERMAHRLLWDEKGVKSDIARFYTNEFKAVYVDEYQDTNRIQDEIFKAISNGNLFIVGDIKQSIYGFRGACPEIFSGYRRPDFSPEEWEKIFLSDNFRSDELVIRFSNALFSTLMPTVDTLGYVKEDDLNFSKRYKEGETVKKEKVELHLFENAKKDEDGEELLYSDEARYVADRIKKEIDEKNYAPSDIAVLVRSSGTRVTELMTALRERNIPISTNEKEDFYKIPHVMLLICLLNFVDDPRRDIYTAGALHSGVFEFTADELVSVKLNHPSADGTLWGSFEELIGAKPQKGEEIIYKKAQKAEKFITAHRSLEKIMGLDEVVRRIIEDSRIVNITMAAADGASSLTVREDIYRIYEDAAVCGARYGMGLSGFVSRLEKLIAMGKSENSPKGAADGVRVMTIHASKGLEFKLCFLYNADKGMNTDTDSLGLYKKSPFEYEPSLGISLPVFDKDGSKVHESSLHRAINAKRERDVKEEEMRLLYVALTRAVEKLIITGKGSEKKIDKALLRPEGIAITEHEVFSAKSFLDWIMLCFKSIDEKFYTLSYNTKFEISLDDTSEHDSFERDAFECDAREHDAPKHDASEYDAPKHDASEYDASKHDVSEYDASKHDVSEYDALKSDTTAYDRAAYDISHGKDDAREVCVRTRADGDESRTETKTGSKAESKSSSKTELKKESRTESKSGSKTVKISPEDIKKAELVKKAYPFSHLKGIPAKLTVSKLYPEILDEFDTSAGIDSFDTTSADEFKLPSFMEAGTEKNGAERGTATHLFMQFCNFENVEMLGVENEAKRLAASGFIPADASEKMDAAGLERFFRSELYAEMKKAKRLFREQRFNIKLPAGEFTASPEKKAQLSGQEIFVQGVIDCVFEDKYGNIVLVDYKTDGFPPKSSEEYIRSALEKRYYSQLYYYKKAVGEIFGKEPERVLLYSFALNNTVKMPV